VLRVEESTTPVDELLQTLAALRSRAAESITAAEAMLVTDANEDAVMRVCPMRPSPRHAASAARLLNSSRRRCVYDGQAKFGAEWTVEARPAALTRIADALRQQRRVLDDARAADKAVEARLASVKPDIVKILAPSPDLKEL